MTRTHNNHRETSDVSDQTSALSHDSTVQIACVGLGFVGYNTALAFSHAEYPVIGIDTDEELLEAVRAGNSPFETTELAPFIDDGSCHVSTEIADASDADVYVISVPTPLGADDTPDLSYVRSAARDVSSVLEAGDLVVLQSTVYPGCTRNEVLPELERSGLEPEVDFGVSHVPERYSPGNDVSKQTARVVGSITDEWCELTADLYEDVADSTVPVSSLEVAETTKLTENAQRDVNIAFVNELAVAAERIGIDVWEVLDGADTKWNFQRYEPGFGVGGHCLPVDAHYLRAAAEDAGANLRLIPSARAINGSMPNRYAEKLFQLLDATEKSLSSAVIAVLGVTYKPDVKDTRNSSALELIELLRNQSISVEVFDPCFDTDERIDQTELSNTASAMEAVQDADAVVIATAHSAFHQLDPATLAATMRSDPVLIDPHQTFDPDAVTESQLIQSQDLSTPTIPNLQANETNNGIPVSGVDGETEVEQ